MVVGAGLAGLTAAYRLHQWGFDVDVYEARRRPGGRVCTAYFDQCHEELGGKNLRDGGDARHLRSLIQELGLSIHGYSLNLCRGLFLYQGSLVPIEKLISEGPRPTEALHDQLLSKIRPLVSLADLVDPLFVHHPPLRAFIELFIRGYLGLSSSLVSATYLDIGFWTHYKELYEAILIHKSHAFQIEEVKGGNSLLVEAMVQALQGHIHYNMPLRKLGDQDRLLLTFDNELVIEATHAILAIPDSTLRDVAIQEGLLPADQWEAIQKRSYGTNAKIIIPCPENKLKTSIFHCLDECCVWSDEHGDVVTWYYGGCYGEFRNDKIDAIFQRNHTQLKVIEPHILVNNTTLTPMKEELRAYYQGPVYVSWICEEFSKGSFSNFTPACAERFSELSHYHGERLRHAYRPVRDRLFFAGEQTAVNHPSTMEGAVESGELAARLIQPFCL